MSPKVVQQAVRLAVALANPTLREQDCKLVKEKFKLDDATITNVLLLIDTMQKNPGLKSLMACLVFDA